MKGIAIVSTLAFVFATGCIDTGDGSDDPNDPNVDSTEQALTTNEHDAFNFFVNRGLTKRQAAGIVGNLIQESGVNPTAVEFGGGPGRGIAQWSVGGRWDTSFHDNMTWYANTHGYHRWGLYGQLHFIWYELTTFGYGLHELRNTTTVHDATIVFMDRFEICGTCDATKRIQYADEVYNAFK